MLVDRIAKRYAASIYALCEEKGQVDAVRQELEQFVHLHGQSAELRQLLATPVLNPQQKIAVLHKIFAQASELFLTLSDLLARRRREGVLPSIGEEFLKLYNRKHQRVEVIITSATPLDTSVREQLLNRIREKRKLEPVVIEKTDPSLIGGFVVELGGEVFDGSVATSLQSFKKELVETRYTRKI